MRPVHNIFCDGTHNHSWGLNSHMKALHLNDNI